MSTTYFVRPSGSNSNDGLTFATAFLTVTKATSVAVAGDAIKVEKTSDPTSIGNATWTKGSNVLTLASALTKTVDNCDSAWTASANVTATADSTANLYKTGTACAKLAIAAAFTTGLVARHSMSSTDFSGYQQLTFWILTSTAQAAGVFAIKLCSDTAGATPVNTFTINEALIANTWRMVTIDLATNLGATIQSVALYAVSDPGTVNVRLDNIEACLASSNAASLTLTSLVGKNTGGEETFLPIMSIVGTTVVLSGNITDDPIPTNTQMTYSGTTETVTTYKRETAMGVPNNSSVTSSWGNVSCTGTAASPITISGGWDPATSMTTQTGDTWRTERSNKDMGLSITSAAAFVSISKLHFTMHRFGVYMNEANNITVSGCHMPGNAEYGSFSDLNHPGSNIWDSCLASFNPTVGIVLGNRDTVISPVCRGNGIYGIFFNGATDCVVTDPICRGNGSAGIDLSGGSGNRIYRPITSDNGLEAYHFNNGRNFLFNASFNESTFVSIGTSTNYMGQKLFSHNHGNVSGVHKTYMAHGVIATDLSQVEKGSGPAWKISVTSAIASATYPVQLGTIGGHEGIKIACKANLLCTVSLRVRRDDTGLTLKMVVPGGQLAGVPSDIVVTAAGSANTYETLTTTFTPTEDGVIDVLVQAYGGTTFNAWVDTMPAMIQA